MVSDVTIGGTPAGRVQIELFADTVPKTAENVRQFFTGEYRYALPNHDMQTSCIAILKRSGSAALLAAEL